MKKIILIISAVIVLAAFFACKDEQTPPPVVEKPVVVVPPEEPVVDPPVEPVDPPVDPPVIPPTEPEEPIMPPIGPEEPGEETGLKGTTWKLVGFVDVETEELKVAEPKDPEDYYLLKFVSDTRAEGHACYMRVVIDLSDLEKEWNIEDVCDPCEDGYRFRTAVAYVKSYSIISGELKLFYQLPYDKNYYLLFKRIK